MIELGLIKIDIPGTSIANCAFIGMVGLSLLFPMTLDDSFLMSAVVLSILAKIGAL